MFSLDSILITPGGMPDIENVLKYCDKLQKFALNITITEFPASKLCINRENKVF